MKKGNTKQEILLAALDLFSVKGYEGTSISEIAQKVGIKKATMYSHFTSKQEILDELVKTVFEEYNKHTIFKNTNFEEMFDLDSNDVIDVNVVIEKVLKHVSYIIHSSVISKSRKMLLIEQFQNETLSELQTKQNYTDVLNYFTSLFEYLIVKDKLKAYDPEIMAASFAFTISVWINLVDRSPEKEDEVNSLITRHITQFFKVYSK